MMHISIKTLALQNFKNHTSLNVDFGELTKISGKNGVGKSTIGDAITWCLFGTDIMGSKLNPNPVGVEEGTESKVELLLQVDGKNILLGRNQKKNAKYYINEVPERATKFNELVESLIDKNLFLSMFSPAYFFTQHWQDQRAQLLQYIKEPLNKEVLAQLSKLDQERLTEHLQKQSLEDLDKIHRDRAREKEKAYDRAAERVITLEEQLSKKENKSIDVDYYQKETEVLHKKRAAIDDVNSARQKNMITRNRLEVQIENLSSQITTQKQLVQGIKDEQVNAKCSSCGQPLDGESIKKVKENRQVRYNKEVQKGKALVQKVNDLKTELSEMPIPQEINHQDLYELEDKLMEYQMLIQTTNQLRNLESDYNAAVEKKEALRKELITSKSIVDAVKEFKTKRSELMVQKVDNLFITISVRLFETLKNGEEKATFEIEMDGIPYSKLSTAEKIKAGLELIEVLSNQSEVIMPTFIDNAESVLNFTAPSGQVIVARVKDEDFNIKAI